MSEEPQPRDIHGHFEKKHSCNCQQDISIKDVTKAIKALDELRGVTYPSKKEISVPEPVKFVHGFDDSISVDIYHHHDEAPTEDIFIKIAIGVLALIAAIYLIQKVFLV
jgi:hypothetical protein